MKPAHSYGMRYISVCIFIISMMVLPWWVSLIGASVMIFIFPVLWEVILVTVLYDSIYMTIASTPRPGIMTLITLVVFIVAYYLRPRLSWYHS